MCQLTSAQAADQNAALTEHTIHETALEDMLRGRVLKKGKGKGHEKKPKTPSPKSPKTKSPKGTPPRNNKDKKPKKSKKSFDFDGTKS